MEIKRDVIIFVVLLSVMTEVDVSILGASLT